MRAEHIKGLLAEARKEDTVAGKTASTEGTTSVIGETGGEDTEEKRDKTPVEMTH